MDHGPRIERDRIREWPHDGSATVGTFELGEDRPSCRPHMMRRLVRAGGGDRGHPRMVLGSGGPAEFRDEFRTHLNPFRGRRVAGTCVDGEASEHIQWNRGQFCKRVVIRHQKGERLEPYEMPGQVPWEGLAPASATPECDIDSVCEQSGHRRTESTMKAGIKRWHRWVRTSEREDSCGG